MLPLAMPSCWLVSVTSLAGCSATLSFVYHERISHQNETFLWFFRASLVCFMSLSSCPQINTLLRRRVSFLPLCRPRGLVNCMGFHFASAVCKVGGPALFFFFFLSSRPYAKSVHDLRFDMFTVPSLDDFVGGDGEKLLLCPITAL